MLLHEAIDDYLLDLGNGNSKLIVETYMRGLTKFSRYLESTRAVKPDDDVKRLMVRHALQFANYVRQEVDRKELCGSTMKVYLTAVSRFFMFCLRMGILDLSMADLMRLTESFKQYRKVQKHRPLPKLPETSDVEQCLTTLYHVEANTPRRELERLRNIALFEALRSSGMRVAELCGLKRGDLNPKDRTARVIGNGDKMRIVFFDTKAWEALQSYFNTRDLVT